MTPPTDPIIIACQFGALGIVYGLIWLLDRWQRRRARRWVPVLDPRPRPSHYRRPLRRAWSRPEVRHLVAGSAEEGEWPE